MSVKYNVSRKFIYENAQVFSGYFQDDSPDELESQKENSIRFIISARMEGKCSLNDISSLMKRMQFSNNSVGFISQTLTAVGQSLGNKLNIKEVQGFTFSVCSDEIFSNSKPILITVDPVSLLILKIELSKDRSKQAWDNHYEGIYNQGISFSQITSDEGLGLKASANGKYSNINRQSDTFHAVAHRLGLYVERLFKKAYKVLEQESDYLLKFKKAKSLKTRIKYLNKYLEISKQVDKKVSLYQDFEILYQWLLNCFEAFDYDGNLKDINSVKLDFDFILELIKGLGDGEICKEVKSIKNCSSDLFTYYHTAQNKINLLCNSVDNDIVSLFCMTWQMQKNLIKYKGKNKYYKDKLKRKIQHIFNDIKEFLGDQFELVKKYVYSQLDQIIQSSAAVECINSILRHYLDTFNNKVSQTFLNMFMFYHNHRKFAHGKRKGKSPMEIALDSKDQPDWLDEMLRNVA